MVQQHWTKAWDKYMEQQNGTTTWNNNMGENGTMTWDNKLGQQHWTITWHNDIGQ